MITLNIISAFISFSVGMWWFYRMRQEKTLPMLTNLEYLILVIVCIHRSLACLGTAPALHTIAHITEDVFGLFAIPIMYNIMSELVMNNANKRRVLLTFIPALAVGIVTCVLHLIFFYVPDIHSRFLIYLNSHLFIIVLFLQLLIFEYALMRDFYAYRQKIFCYYVDIQTTDFTKVHRVMICFFFISIIIYLRLVFHSSYVDIDGNSNVILLTNSCIAAIMYFVGWNLSCLARETTVVDVACKLYTPDEVLKMAKIAGNGFLPETDKQIPTTDMQTMDSLPSANEGTAIQVVEDAVGHWKQRPDKPFLKEGITLAMAADDMNLDIRIVSLYLNRVLKINFNAWINTLRIEEVKRILDSHSEQTVSAIAFNCGFSDTPMLCKTFKKIVGMTITEYKKVNDLV